MKLVSIFRTPVSVRLTDVGILAARLGMAFAFIWPGLNKLTDPAGIGQMIQTMGLDPLMAVQVATLIGTLEVLSGLFVAVGFMTRPSAIFQIVILIGAQAIFGFNYMEGPAIWKDPGLLGLAILLLLTGGARFSVDHLISRDRNIKDQKVRV
ncbi:DoxX family protein [soil metagenome]